MSVCLSKGLGPPFGSLVAGSAAFIDRVHRFRKMFGGQMWQAGILAAARIYALDNHRKRLTEDHRNAKRLALDLSEFRGVTVNHDHVETNIVIFDVASNGKTTPQIAVIMKGRNGLIHTFGKTQIRLVTHLGISSEEVEKVLEALRRVFR